MDKKQLEFILKAINNKIKNLEESEEETLNKLLSYGLVVDSLMLDDGTYLEDENGKLLQI